MRRPTIFSLLWLGVAILCAVPASVVAEGPVSAEHLAGNAIRAGQTQDTSALKTLAGLLVHESRIVRRSAVWAFSQMPQAVADFVFELTTALADEDAQVRWGAATALEKIGHQAGSAEGALWRATQDRDIDVRCAALMALRTVSVTKHTAAVSALSECLRSSVADVQAEAIATLTAVHSRWNDDEKRAIAAQLASVFANSNADLRLAAAVLLGDLGLSAADSITVLAGATDDLDEHVQAATLRAIGQFAGEVDQRWNRLDAKQRRDVRPACAAAAKVLEARGRESAEVARLAEQFQKMIAGMQLISVDGVVALPRTANSPAKSESDANGETSSEATPSSPNRWRWAFAGLLACLGVWGLRQSLSGRSAANISDANNTRAEVAALPETPASKVLESEAATRCEAFNSASDIALDVVLPFVQALQDEDARVRQAAAITLGRIGLGAIDAIPQLIVALADAEPRVRAAAAFALSAFGAHALEAVPALRAALSDGFAAVRARAAFALGQIGPASRRAAEELARLVCDPDVSVRCNVASAFGGIGADTAIVLPALRQAASDHDSRVRICAMTTLALIDTGSAAADSQRAQQDVDADARQRDPSVPDLKLFCPEQSDNPVVAGDIEQPCDAADFIGQLEDADADVRWNATQGLEQLGASAVSEMTESLNHRNPAVRRLLIVALGRLGAEARSAMPALLVALHDVNSDVRCAAADCLGQLGVVSRSIVQALVHSLRDPNAEVRRYAATTLGRFGQQACEATTALQIASISDIAAKVRGAAQTALQRISESLVGAA